MADPSVPRNIPELNQIAAQFDRRVYKLIRPQQRNHYRSKGSDLHSRSLFWLVHGNRIVVGSVVGLCVASYAANWYAENLAQRTRNHKPLDFIRQNFVCSLGNVKAGRWWVMATSSVMHTNGIHLSLNMWALWSIGPFTIGYFGVPQFLGLCLFAGVSCSAASLYWTQFKEELRRLYAVGRRWDSLPHQRPQWTRYINLGTGNGAEFYGGAVGTSGSLSGLYTAMMCMMPRVPVSLIGVPFLSFPLWSSNAVFAAGSAYCMVTGTLPLIAHAGHLGGMAGGVAYFYGVMRPILRRMGR